MRLLFLSNIDLAKNELQNARLQNLATEPASPVSGQIYFNTVDKKFYGWNGTGWIDLSLVLSNKAIVDAITAAYTTGEQTKLSGISTGANKTEVSSTNGNIKVDGAEKTVYTHPSSDGNLHVPATSTTNNGKVLKAGSTAGSLSWGTLAKADVGLGSVDNTADSAKSVASAAKLTTARKLTIAGDVDGNATFDGSADTTITVALDTTGVTAGTYKSVTVDTKGRITSATNPTTISGYGISDAVQNAGDTPSLKSGLENARPAATGSGAVYLSTDTGSIWKDAASGTWTKMGGQDLQAATSTTLGGVKVGANLTVTADGTLNANDNPASFIRKQDRFTVTAGQTLFNLTNGTYKPDSSAMTWFLNGIKQDDRALTETSSTSVTLPDGVPEGSDLLLEYYEVISWHPFPVHANEHLTGGADAIPLVTTTTDGLARKEDKTKLDGIASGAEVNEPAFKTIKVSGQSDIVAELDADTLTLVAGGNVTITTDASTDTVTVAAKDTTYTVATISADGLMSSGDKTKLDGVATGANNYVHPTGDGNTHVPSTGTTNSGKVLKAGSTANSAAWGSLSASEVGAVPTTDVVTTATASKILKLDANSKLPASITGNADGNAATATKLQNGSTLSITGDGTGTSASFDGSGNASIPLTLANSGVTAGTYPKVTVDSKGRVTGGSSLLAGDIPTLTLSKISDAGTAAGKNTGTASGNVPIVGLDGKLDASILPALAITDTFPVANEAEMLALTAEVGDIAVRADENKSYILRVSGTSILSNWQELLTPTDSVISVAGKTGVVTLNSGDVGLGNVTNESKATMFTSPALTGTPTAPTATATTNTTQVATTAFVKAQNYITSSGAPVQSVAGKTGAVALVSSDVGLGNVTNESKATMFTSPALTGTPTAPTATATTNTTQVATTAFVKSQNYITSSGAPVQSVSGKTGAITLANSDVGLGNVENKSSATIRGEITSSNITTALGYTPAQKKTANIGDGTATQFTVTHNLNTLDVTTSLRDVATNQFVICDVQTIDVNSIKLLFGSAPTSNQYSVAITG